MAEPSTAQARFQMVGARAAVLDGSIAEAIEQQIHAIENALASVPDFAFDLSKTLVESVCKTVLADIGQPADPNWDAPKLLRETTNRLALLPRNHPDPAKARDSVEKTVRDCSRPSRACANSATATAWPPTVAMASPPGLISGRPRSPPRQRTPS